MNQPIATAEQTQQWADEQVELARDANATPEQVERFAAELARRSWVVIESGDRIMAPELKVAAARMRAELLPAPTIAVAPVATAPATPAGKTRVAIAASGRDFSKAIKWAKQVGGSFDPATKTWLIPSDSNFLNAPGTYGWRIVK